MKISRFTIAIDITLAPGCDASCGGAPMGGLWLEESRAQKDALL